MAKRRVSPKRRNMTITLEEEVARWARVRAAEQDTSVGHLVGDLLKSRMRQEDGYFSAMREHFALLKPVAFRKTGDRFPTRDEIHERSLGRS